MWRIIAGILIGALLFFPGVVLLQWLAVDVLGLYEKMTLTDGCLAFIIILQCIIIMQQLTRSRNSSAGIARHPARLTMMGGERGEIYPLDQEEQQAPPRPTRRGYDR